MIREDQAPFQQVLGRGLQKCWLRIQLPEVEEANRPSSFYRKETGGLLRTTYMGSVVVVKCHRAHSSSSCWSSYPCNISIVAQIEGTMEDTLEELRMEDKDLQAWGCRGAWGLSLELGSGGKVGSLPAGGVCCWMVCVDKEMS